MTRYRTQVKHLSAWMLVFVVIFLSFSFGIIITRVTGLGPWLTFGLLASGLGAFFLATLLTLMIWDR